MTTPKWPIKNDLLEKDSFRFKSVNSQKKTSFSRRDFKNLSFLV